MGRQRRQLGLPLHQPQVGRDGLIDHRDHL
jgi:hypothetical protein